MELTIDEARWVRDRLSELIDRYGGGPARPGCAEAEGIVRELAAMERAVPDPDRAGLCHFCGAKYCSEMQHGPACAWKRAREWVRRNGSAGT